MAGRKFRAEVIAYIANDPVTETAENDAITCKFVVIGRSDSLDFVIGAVSEFPYHATLIDRYCRERGVPSSWIKRPDRVEIYDKSIKIYGGGLARISRSRKICRIYGMSTVYGRYVLADVKRIVETSQFFSDFDISIEK